MTCGFPFGLVTPSSPFGFILFVNQFLSHQTAQTIAVATGEVPPTAMSAGQGASSPDRNLSRGPTGYVSFDSPPAASDGTGTGEVETTAASNGGINGSRGGVYGCSHDRGDSHKHDHGTAHSHDHGGSHKHGHGHDHSHNHETGALGPTMQHAC